MVAATVGGLNVVGCGQLGSLGLAEQLGLHLGSFEDPGLSQENSIGASVGGRYVGA